MSMSEGFDYRAARSAVFGSTLPAQARLVLLVLVEHMPTAFPSVSRIAEHSGLSRRQVMREIQRLEEVGVVRVIRRCGLPNTYTLPDQWTEMLLVTNSHQCPTDTSDQQSPVTDSHPTSDQQSPPPVTDSHPKQEVKQEVKREGSRSHRSRSSAAKSKGKGESKTPQPGHAELVGFYFDAFERKRGTKPLFGGAEAKAVSRLLDAVKGDAAKAKVIVGNALASWQGDSIPGDDNCGHTFRLTAVARMTTVKRNDHWRTIGRASGDGWHFGQ